MAKNNNGMADILIQALPYIQKYNNKIIVIKYGGNAMINEELKKNVIEDIVLLSLVGIKIVLVHGGGIDISQMLKKVGKEGKFINGLRYTDKETMEIVQMVLAGKTNKDLVSLIESFGGSAVGLCGIDFGFIQCEKLEDDEVDYGFVGKIKEINPIPILDILKNNYIPVISTIGTDKKGNSYNINADIVASELALALHADNLIIMTDVDGLLKDIKDASTLIKRVKLKEVDTLINEGIISGGMIPKVNCCTNAVANGVSKANIINGTIKHSILIEILSDDGVGTMFIKDW